MKKRKSDKEKVNTKQKLGTNNFVRTIFITILVDSKKKSDQFQYYYLIFYINGYKVFYYGVRKKNMISISLADQLKVR